MKRTAMIITAALLTLSTMVATPRTSQAQAVMCQGLVATIVGTNGNNVLIGGPGQMRLPVWTATTSSMAMAATTPFVA